MISSAKDKAEMTVNTALSLALITVLKHTLDMGSEAQYYYLSVILLCLTLSLQVC